MPSLLIPTIPNSPLAGGAPDQSSGQLSLRKNSALDFIENAAFDPNLAQYDDNYQNSQAFSSQFQDHMKNVLELLKDRFPKGTSVVEVGCGKGDFVEMIQRDGHFQVTGYDAAYEGTNPAIEKRYLANSDRIETELVVLRHVLEHIPRPHDFLAMLKSVFGGAQIYIEVPDIKWIVDNGVFFDITYEHVNYFSRQSLSTLFGGNVTETGLCFHDQYQYVLADLNELSGDFANQYESGAWELIDFDTLFPMLNRKIEHIDRLLSEGRRGVLWGAGTKGCMFLVHGKRLDKVVDKIAYAIDVNPNKWNKFLPSTRIPIKSKDDFFRDASPNDVLIVANPNYFDEISQDVRERLSQQIEIICL